MPEKGGGRGCRGVREDEGAELDTKLTTTGNRRKTSL